MRCIVIFASLLVHLAYVDARIEDVAFIQQDRTRFARYASGRRVLNRYGGGGSSGSGGSGGSGGSISGGSGSGGSGGGNGGSGGGNGGTGGGNGGTGGGNGGSGGGNGGSGSGGGGGTSPVPPPVFPPSLLCSSFCSVQVGTLGLGYGACIQGGKQSCADFNGLYIKNPTEECLGGCNCCILTGKLSPNVPSTVPPTSPVPEISFPPQPPGGGVCETSVCGKYVPGLGVGFGTCVPGDTPQICEQYDGIKVEEYQGCSSGSGESKDACHCCILLGRKFEQSPPSLPSIPPPPPLVSPPPPFPPQVGECAKRLCQMSLSDGTLATGVCLSGPDNSVCEANGLLEAGSDAVGCDGSDCHCCVGSISITGSPPPPPPTTGPPTESPPPPPTGTPIESPPPPPEKVCSSDTLCGVKLSDSSIIYGRCIVGKGQGGAETCDNAGGRYLGSSSIGCSASDDCFCCGPKEPEVQTPPPAFPPPPPEDTCGDLCGVKESGAITYGKCFEGKDPVQLCRRAGGQYAGDSSVGCGRDCSCCIPSAPPTSTCTDSVCGYLTKDTGKTILGKCFTGGSSGVKTCDSNGLIYAGDQSSGCNPSDGCYCCTETTSQGILPPPPATSPPPPSPPPPSSPPPSSPPPSSPPPSSSPPPPSSPPPSSSPPPPPVCPSTCSATLDGTVFTGSCQPGNFPTYDSAIATCAQIDAVPVSGLCGDGCGICCISSAALCNSNTGPNSPSCANEPCKCILTQSGANCNAPVYTGYNPPPGNGQGCQENFCNAVAAKEGVKAACCPFC